MKKVLSAIICIILALSMLVPASAASYYSYTAPSWATAFIDSEDGVSAWVTNDDDGMIFLAIDENDGIDITSLTGTDISELKTVVAEFADEMLDLYGYEKNKTTVGSYSIKKMGSENYNCLVMSTTSTLKDLYGVSMLTSFYFFTSDKHFYMFSYNYFSISTHNASNFESSLNTFKIKEAPYITTTTTRTTTTRTTTKPSTTTGYQTTKTTTTKPAPHTLPNFPITLPPSADLEELSTVAAAVQEEFTTSDVSETTTEQTTESTTSTTFEFSDVYEQNNETETEATNIQGAVKNIEDDDDDGESGGLSMNAKIILISLAAIVAILAIVLILLLKKNADNKAQAANIQQNPQYPQYPQPPQNPYGQYPQQPPQNNNFWEDNNL